MNQDLVYGTLMIQIRFPLCYSTWNVKKLIPEDCPHCADNLLYFYHWFLFKDSNVKVGLYSSYEDFIISSFYLNMNSSAFKDYLLFSSTFIYDSFPDRFKRFFVNGTSHCVSNYNYIIHNISIYNWINGMIENSSDWQDLME